MRPSPRRITVPALLALILLLAACGAQDAASPSAAASEASGDGGTDESQPASGGGTVSIGFEGDIASLDPSQGYDYISWPAERLIF